MNYDYRVLKIVLYISSILNGSVPKTEAASPCLREAASPCLMGYHLYDNPTQDPAAKRQDKYVIIEDIRRIAVVIIYSKKVESIY